MKRLAWLAMVAVVGLMLTGGSTGFGAPHKKAPAKHGGGKQAHPNAKQSKPKQHPAHNGGAKTGKGKEEGTAKQKQNGKESKEKAKEDHKDKPADPNSKKEGDERRGEKVIVNKPVGPSVGGATPGVVTPGGTGAAVSGAGDAGPADAGVPNVGGPGLPGRPQLVYSFNVPERDRYDAAARAAGVSRDEWIRTRLNAAVGREVR
jgi:hypothetical protein